MSSKPTLNPSLDVQTISSIYYYNPNYLIPDAKFELILTTLVRHTLSECIICPLTPLQDPQAESAPVEETCVLTQIYTNLIGA